MNDTLYLIVGKSGSGKDTVINKVCELFNYTKVISYTTRPMRTPDENTHIFVTDKDFNMAKDIVAYTRFFRMLGRGDGFTSAINRLINDHKAFKNLEADYVVNNINSVIRAALYIVENIVKYS